MTRLPRTRIVLFFAVLGLALGGCLSSVVDSSTSSSRPDPLVGRWRGLGDDSGFQYQFLDSGRMVVTRSNFLQEGDSVRIDTLPIVFEPGGFFFRWRYKGEFSRHYCFRKGDTLIMGLAAMGRHQQVYPRIPTPGKADGNQAYGMWESILCSNIHCLLDTAVIDEDGFLWSTIERRKFGTEPLPVVFEDEMMTVHLPDRGFKRPMVHMVRNDSLWLLETGTICDSETEPCLPNSRVKMVRR